MKTLLIDAGNTTVDFRVYNAENKTLTKKHRFYTYTNEWKDPSLFNDSEYDQIIFASVVPDFTSYVNELNLHAIDLKDTKHWSPEAVGIDNVEELGADFIANLHAIRQPNTIIVSLGTTTTFMKVTNYKFDGVIIAPGIRNSLKTMIRSAAQLKNSKFEWSDKKIGFNTLTAINIGAINGHFEMIKGLIRQLEIDESYKVIVTGGNANLIKQGITNENWIYNEKLIFDGMIKML
ncbi:type III pantothenate kinase [Williamsoniiplasma luminosum]|uniref:Type III pantothenate kinase n=1 Tax=Williamsoniiplasma luminosum TaxID=214888 RepID=A0A2K8NWJ8_9MOLU|nr:type III pantothenate kinase [Williamsoniiplasma luminosum]ATZ17111.1 type III pantothenate kinase [Williamsoniiplasma luminosum]